MPISKEDVRAAMPEDVEVQRLAEFYSAFSDPGRIKIIRALEIAGELCVKDLSAITGASESALSHQLKILKLLRLIASRQQGRQVFYRLDDDHIYRILRAGKDHIKESS